jgi:hypothetical protein
MEVTVDGEPCPKERFIRGRVAHYPQRGCRVKVVRENELTPWHRSASPGREYLHNVLLNFHGQVVSFSYRPVSTHDLSFLVDMTSQPTGIRLMLPARTCLVENDAFKQLKAVLELEAYKYLQRQGRHRLTYKEYLRGRELGIELPEAEPCFRIGLLWTDIGPEPVEVTMPKGHVLSQCYRLAENKDRDQSDEANVHLLAALGKLDQPFVPVEIKSDYDGYSWAKLPTIDRVKLSAGKSLQESWMAGGLLMCVDSLVIAAHCSDGKVYRSAVCLAVKPWDRKERAPWNGDAEVYVTPEARGSLSYSDLWYHLGGFNDGGDSYDTQEYQVGQEIAAFWTRLEGPDEPLRQKLMECVSDLEEKGWRSVLIRADGKVTIRRLDGSEKLILPPEPATVEEVSS